MNKTQEEQIIFDYAQYIHPYVRIKKAWLELNEKYGYIVQCLYDGFYDNEVGYSFMNTFDKQEALDKMEAR